MPDGSGVTDAQALVALLHPRLVELAREFRALGMVQQAAATIEALTVVWETAHEVNPGFFTAPPPSSAIDRYREERKTLLALEKILKEG